MRVLHLYSGNLFGGIERMLVTLAHHRALCRSVEPLFGLCFEGRLMRELRACGAAVNHLGDVRLSRPWSVIRARRRLRSALAAQQPDVVVCHSCWAHAVFAPVVRAEGLPLAFMAHDVPSGSHWLERLAARIVPDLVIANSRFTMASVPKLFPGVKTEVHHCPVERRETTSERELRNRLRESEGAGPGTVVIVMACRLERWKGHRLLLGALAELARKPGGGSDWQCWIMGGPQRPPEQLYWSELRSEAGQLGIADRVRWLGQREDVAALLSAADIHCQPNEGPEPFGVAFIEALLAGLPVVTTRMGGAAEILDERVGILVPPGDVAALAQALAELIEDPRQRAELARTGPARARELTDPTVVMPRFYDALARIRTVSAPACLAGKLEGC